MIPYEFCKILYIAGI